MRRLSRAAVIAAVLAMVGAAGASTAVNREVIAFTAVVVKQKQGQATYTATEKDYVGSKQIGHDNVTCVVTTRTTAACNVEFVQQKGKLYLAFTQRFNQSGGHGHVIWGTGAYKNAAGTFTYKNLNKAGTRTKVAITLKYPSAHAPGRLRSEVCASIGATRGVGPIFAEGQVA